MQRVIFDSISFITVFAHTISPRVKYSVAPWLHHGLFLNGNLGGFQRNERSGPVSLQRVLQRLSFVYLINQGRLITAQHHHGKCIEIRRSSVWDDTQMKN